MKDPKLLRKELLEIPSVIKKVIYTPKELSAQSHPEALVELSGDLINMSSFKLQTFASDGVRCRICGCKGAYFAKEKYPGEAHYHLNLYALKDKREVLMTKDHVIPIAKGGRDQLKNFQTLCVECNRKKADTTAQKVKKDKMRPKK